MTTARLRPLLAAAAAAALLSYGLFGHALPRLESHDGMPGAAAGLCLLLVTALGYAALKRPKAERPALVANAHPAYVGAPARPPLDTRARASPSVLQRFRN
jgi:hypothetical protein